MNSSYRVFSERYNKILDLIEKVDVNLSERYEKTVSKFPEALMRKLQAKKEFECDGLDFKAALEKYAEMLSFEYITYDKFLCTTVNIYPFYEEDLLERDEDDSIYINPEIDENNSEIFIFSLNFADTEGEEMMSPVFEEQDGKFVFTGTIGTGFEIQYEVFIEKKDEDLFLVSKKTINELPVYEKRFQMTYEELVRYSADEENEYVQENEEDFSEVNFEEYIIDDMDLDEYEL